eukprot:COSAG06_NODE_40073_length_405_cov_8.751634_1_plen_58_part_10
MSAPPGDLPSSTCAKLDGESWGWVTAEYKTGDVLLFHGRMMYTPPQKTYLKLHNGAQS